MRPVHAHQNGSPTSWSSLLAYYRQCLEREQMQRLQVSLEKKGYALLRGSTDRIITHGATDMLISNPSDLQQVRQLLARKGVDEDQSLYYAFPLVSQQKKLVPVCYTQVSAEPGPEPGSLLIRREGDLLVNRRFLVESVELTDAEVAEFARHLGAPGPVEARLGELLGDGVVTPGGMLFRSDPDVVTRSLLRELEWLERQPCLSPPLSVFIQGGRCDHALPPTSAVTVVRSNPAQDRVLRNRSSVLQVVAGPPGTGKTQTIINLIASAICDGQTVLFTSKNNAAVDNVAEAFLQQDLFPGVLRLGSQEVRTHAVEHLRKLLDGLRKGVPLPGNQVDWELQGLAPAMKIAGLEEELSAVERLQATEGEMALVLQRTDENLRGSGLHRFADDLARQITPETAGQFRPQQLVGLRRLAARTADWQEPPVKIGGRLLDRVGILDSLRMLRLQLRLRGLRLPACCAVAGHGLSHRLDALLRLEAVYPFLLATARHCRARADMSVKRTPDAIRADLDKAYSTKMGYDRERLKRRWAELVNAAQPKASQLLELVPLFERMDGGTADTSARREWWRRYGELLTVFPVICSTNLSLASAAPNEEGRFDLVILDEASQSDIPSFLPALYRARRAVVVGDDRQLTHISNLGDEEDARLMAAAGISRADTLSYHQHSAFDRAMAVAGQTAFTLLDRHYR